MSCPCAECRFHHGPTEDVGKASEPGTHGLSADELEFHAWPRPDRGGQHTGMSGSGVLVVHIATGAAFVSTDERSQIRNRAAALAGLAALLAHVSAP